MVEYATPEYRDTGWPIAYRNLAGFLRTARDADVPAVFIDLVLTLPRESDRLTAPKTSKSASHQETPIRSLQSSESEFCDFAAVLAELSTGIRPDKDPWISYVLYGENEPNRNGSSLEARTVTDDCISRAISTRDQTNSSLPSPVDLPPQLRARAAANRMHQTTASGQSFTVVIAALKQYLETPSEVANEMTWAKHKILDSVAILTTISTLPSEDSGYRLIVGKNGLPSPALLLAHKFACSGAKSKDYWFCLASNVAAGTATDEAQFGDQSIAKFDEQRIAEIDTIELVWGGLTAARSQDLKAIEPLYDCGTDKGRLKVLSERLLFGTSPGTTLGKRSANATCPYHQALPYRYFDQYSRCAKIDQLVKNVSYTGKQLEDCSTTSKELPGKDIGWTERNREAIAVMAKKYVFLGASFEVAKDEIVAPVLGRIPAVHSHAMAFDNLLHKRPPNIYPERSTSLDWYMTILRFLLVFVGVLGINALRDQIDDSRGKRESGVANRQEGLDQRSEGWWGRVSVARSLLVSVTIGVISAYSLLIMYLEFTGGGWAIPSGSGWPKVADALAVLLMLGLVCFSALSVHGALLLHQRPFLMRVLSRRHNFDSRLGCAVSRACGCAKLAPHILVLIGLFCAGALLSYLASLSTGLAVANFMGSFVSLLAVYVVFLRDQLSKVASWILNKDVYEYLV